MKIAWDHCYSHPLPVGHRFPMLKYELLPEQLLHEGTISSPQLFHPAPLSELDLLRVHDPSYWQKLLTLDLSRQEERRTGFPLSKELVHRERVIMQGTIDCALAALTDGVSMNIAGGTHHAFRDRGEGFCLLNDIALAAMHLLDNRKTSRILVVDLDVHQGNGTASIFAEEERVFTFSMHGASNYPMHKESSDLDVALADGTDDTTYLELLDRHLKGVMDRFEPDFVFFQSGVDVLASDKLGRLGLSLEGCKERDRMVMEACMKNNVPLCASMGGGYSVDIRQIVEAHANTFRVAMELYF